MKTMNMMKGLAFAAMMVMSMSVMAQRQVNNGIDSQRGASLVVTEHGISRAGNDDVYSSVSRNDNDMRQNDTRNMRGYGDRDARYDDRGGRYDDRGGRYDDRHVGVRGAEPRAYSGRGHDPYAGRVRHMPDGRWGYLRGNSWYYYDCYYEPAYYFSHPVRHFHAHRLGPVGKAVVAGAVIGTVIGLLAR